MGFHRGRSAVSPKNSAGNFDVRGSHFVFRHTGKPGHLSIPGHREIKAGLLKTLIGQMGLSVAEFLALARK
jgi:hypothetical protein